MSQVAVLRTTRINEINFIIQRFSVRLKVVPEVGLVNITPINIGSN